jgi:hypothetical protein
VSGSATEEASHPCISHVKDDHYSGKANGSEKWCQLVNGRRDHYNSSLRSFLWGLVLMLCWRSARLVYVVVVEDKCANVCNAVRCHQGGLNACLLTSVFVSSLTMLARESLSLIKAAFIFRHDNTIKKPLVTVIKVVDSVTKKPLSRKIAVALRLLGWASMAHWLLQRWNPSLSIFSNQ